MGVGYAISAFAEPSSATSSVQLVALGTRGRLCSIWYMPVLSAGEETDLNFKLKDGDSSGSEIFEEVVSYFSIINVGSGVSPINVPEDGILFTNGLNAQSAGHGMHSVTVTYIGEGQV